MLPENVAPRGEDRAVCRGGRRGGPLPRRGRQGPLAADFYARHVPEEYGGAGADALATVIVIAEVARVCVSSSLIPAVNKLGSLPVQISEGDPEEVPECARQGRRRLSHCLSEPDVGSDAGGMRCRAERDGDGWVLNSVKRWITNAGESEFCPIHGRHRR